MNRTNHFLSTSRTALILLLAMLLTATAAQTAWATDLTDFLTVSSSGTASGYFAFSDHFYNEKFYLFLALCSLILQHHFVAEASQRAERVPLTYGLRCSRSTKAMKSFIFFLALCSLIRTFVFKFIDDGA